MKQELPERRLLVRAGDALLTLDLAQIRDLGALPGGTARPLAHVLEIRGPTFAAVHLCVETGQHSAWVSVEGVGGVVEFPRTDVLKLPASVLVRVPGLVRALVRVNEPAQWRGASLLPGAAVPLFQAAPSQRRALAADLDPVALGRLLAETTAPPGDA